MSLTFTCEKCGGGSYEQFSQTQVRCMHCGSISVYDTGYRVVPEFQLSADKDLLDLEIKVDYKTASLVKRLINYIIDLTIGFIIMFFIAILSNLDNTNTDGQVSNITLLLIYLSFSSYYVFMEYKFGKTIGKFITKTKVISVNRNELSLGQCIGRVLCRSIPLYQLSGLLFYGVFWHDSIPITLVVEDN
jgi:uncharacterized RDD family membrane protein YckC